MLNHRPSLWSRALCHLLWLVLVSPLSAQSPNQTPAAISRAIDLRKLSPDQAAQELPVDLKATVSFVDPAGTIFVQDATGGTFFRPARPTQDISVGDVVQITGVTFPGLYLTGIDQAQVQQLQTGTAPLPAQDATFEALSSGRLHYQRVRVRGVIRRHSPLDESNTLISLALGVRTIEVHLSAPFSEEPSWIDSEVSVTGLAAGGINDRRQLVQPYLRAAGWSDVQILRPAPEVSQLPILPTSEILRFDPTVDVSASVHRVRVSGQVLAAFPDASLFLRDSTEAGPGTTIAVHLAEGAPTPPLGSVCDVAGFPRMGDFSAVIEDAVLLESQPGPTASPVPAAWDDLRSGGLDAELVTLTATLVDHFRAEGGWQLQLDLDGHPLMAALPTGTPPDIAPGTRVAVTGIVRIESTIKQGFRSHPERFRLLLRTPDDLRVLKAPPWWTARRLGGLVAVLLTLLSLGTLWIQQLRRQVARQSRILQTRIAREAALDERQRIAREFHDTLEQELTGLSLRLDAATTRPLEHKARTLLETSRSLVSRIQSEARNLVSDLRQTEHASTLTEALQSLATRAPEGLAITLDIPTPIPAIPPHVTHHLRMIAQEALTNTLKHANASTVTLHLSSTATLLTLRITDDGQGFDPTAQTHGQPGHFGCIGIRERARKIGAEVTWESVAGKGTAVGVELPLGK